MDGRLKQIKDKIYWFVAQKNEGINREFGPYVEETRSRHYELRHERWRLLARLNWHYRVLKKKSPLLKQESDIDITDEKYYEVKEERQSIEQIVQKLTDFDIVSFDIFDTALFRKVEKPIDVFDIMALEMQHEDFISIRKQGEERARREKDYRLFTREVSLTEIYRVLERDFGIDKSWMEREIELELSLSEANPFIFRIYKSVLAAGKTVLFTSDMYLEEAVLEKMLKKNGYDEYEKIYVSNAYGKCKGDGSLQRVVLDNNPGKRIIHIGDNMRADVIQSQKAGMDAVYNPSQIPVYRENGMNNLQGSFYRALINNTMNNGMWDHSLYYSHGFRTGGILTTLFCQWLNAKAHRDRVDKILFCARDCDIIYKVYNQLFRECDNEYIQISRFAIMSITSERYLHDLIGRTVLRSSREDGTSKTMEAILCDSGFDFLVDYLEDADIDKYSFASAIDIRRIEKFLYDNADIIVKHNEDSRNAAVKYFKQIIGTARIILIVDVGWSGTCLSAWKYFAEHYLEIQDLSITGALLCTSQSKPVTSAMESGFIESFVYSPFHNRDLTEFMMPQDKTSKAPDIQDMLHMPLEYMFTSCESSLVKYAVDEKGNVNFVRNKLIPSNENEICEMQQGIMDFAEKYKQETDGYFHLFNKPTSSYVAFNPLKEAIVHSSYCYSVYKNYSYDARSAIWKTPGEVPKFGTLFSDETGLITQHREISKNKSDKKKLLFISPEMTYTGAPRSLLRMCKVAATLGYDVDVWSGKPGPFITEFQRYGFEVEVVPGDRAHIPETIRKIKKYDMAVCNAIATHQFARICTRYIPTVWYIREATNIPDFTRYNKQMLYTLQHSGDLCCVSEYAAKAIRNYNRRKILIVHNCVEDEAKIASSYIPGRFERIRFAQLGTLEYRKGYDVLLAAFQKMPQSYQEQAELYFAGGFINSGTSYASYLLNRIKEIPQVHYLGVLTGDDKTKKLSEMDVIVVASRDESCSLVALEGAMLSKPLVVTENVGAKYMVKEDNGYIVKTGNSDDLCGAMMALIDKRDQLKKMGERSRAYYEQSANMESYTQDLAELFRLNEQKGTAAFRVKRMRARLETSEFIRNATGIVKSVAQLPVNEKVIVSLTSYPGRIKTVPICIHSLLKQNGRPLKVLLWLSKKQFPGLENDLPSELLKICKNKRFEIRWTEDDLAPHKKYFYAMQEYPELPIIIVDDDVIYDVDLVRKLMASYRRFPQCVIAMRTNLITFKNNGQLRSYSSWRMGYNMLKDTPSRQLLPTGVGGVLYPPHSIPNDAFDRDVIKATCLYNDDLWLKVWAVHNGYKTVAVAEPCETEEIEGTQETALWKLNVRHNNNDIAMENILAHYKSKYPEKNWINSVWSDMFEQ